MKIPGFSLHLLWQNVSFFCLPPHYVTISLSCSPRFPNIVRHIAFSIWLWVYSCFLGFLGICLKSVIPVWTGLVPYQAAERGDSGNETKLCCLHSQLARRCPSCHVVCNFSSVLRLLLDCYGRVVGSKLFKTEFFVWCLWWLHYPHTTHSMSVNLCTEHL